MLPDRNASQIQKGDPAIDRGRSRCSRPDARSAEDETLVAALARGHAGTEPPLSVETKSRLFFIVHNALTNAFLHARAGRVEVRVDFDAGRLRLSVSDDGVGLPEDYAERGRGFRGMDR